jgi:transposase
MRFRRHTGGKPVAGPACGPTLVHREMILRFLRDLAVPFTNNGSEQEIHPVKIHQRSSGGAWRTLEGLADFATIWPYPISAAKHGISQITALTILFAGEPWLPPLPSGT